MTRIVKINADIEVPEHFDGEITIRIKPSRKPAIEALPSNSPEPKGEVGT